MINFFLIFHLRCLYLQWKKKSFNGKGSKSIYDYDVNYPYCSLTGIAKELGEK